MTREAYAVTRLALSLASVLLVGWGLAVLADTLHSPPDSALRWAAIIAVVTYTFAALLLAMWTVPRNALTSWRTLALNSAITVGCGAAFAIVTTGTTCLGFRLWVCAP